MGSEGRERERALADLIFLHRGNPAASALWDWKSLGEVYADGLRDGDAAAIVTMVERHEGAESAAIAKHWLRAPARGRSTSSAAVDPSCWASAAQIALHEAGEDDIARDPAARAVWAHAQRHAPPRPGDEVLLAPVPDRSRRVSGAVALVQRRDHAQHAGVAGAPASVLVLHRGRRSGGDGAADGLHLLRSGCRRPTSRSAGARYGVFARDWRRVGGVEWLERMAERELGDDAPVPTPSASTGQLLALSQPEFADAVRRALRDLHRPDALATNPLARTRVVRDRWAELPAPEALRELLRRGGRRAACRPARREAGARAGAHLPATRADAGGRRRAARVCPSAPTAGT